MPTRHIGIDEAGYGPLIGPLSIVGAAVEVERPGAIGEAFAETGACDSKELHVPGDLAPLESVALPAARWLSGQAIAHAAELFALLGETATDRADTPWMIGAEMLTLPVAADGCAAWSLAGTRPAGLRGRLIHPHALNRARADGRNRHAIEVEAVADLLRASCGGEGEHIAVVDRLGGRRFYGAMLAQLWIGTPVVPLREDADVSAYRVDDGARALAVEFRVQGERASPLTAIASCIAKYARELHMLLLNRWWCGRREGLRPTAGYGQDAHRWLDDISDDLASHRPILVRE